MLISYQQLVGTGGVVMVYQRTHGNKTEITRGGRSCALWPCGEEAFVVQQCGFQLRHLPHSLRV
uniref:Uncharacterized protein n=1 Tax=Arundo donax TaxID=35708 RepID=A0A0A8YQ73_ARUDO